MKKEITYKSKDNITTIHATVWIPETEIKGIIHLSHGMIEHMEKYEEFALHMNKQGFLVCGNDHLGHGSSVIDREHYGYFAAKNASNILVDDMYELTKLIKEEYPNIPYIIYGHSFGSFILRNYLQKYSNELTATIIAGTAEHNKLFLLYGKIAAKVIAFYKRGPFYRSKYLEKQTTGRFRQYYKNTAAFSWLTKNNEYMESYKTDPKCHFRFTCNAYETMFDLLLKANNNLKNIKKDLPILIISGKDDAVSNFGTAAIKLNTLYKKKGLTNVKLKIYNGLRHSLLHEPEKVIVLNDITQFINSIINQKENQQ